MTRTASVQTSSVDALLEQYARSVAQRGALAGHLWASEFLLTRVLKLMPHLIADTPYNAVARDTLCDEIRELLAEDREHPGLSDGSDEGEAELPSDTERDGHVDV